MTEHAKKSRQRPRRRRVSDESGLSLIEVMFTALIVILISTATAKALVATSLSAGDEQFRSQANALAAQDEDQLRSLSDVQLNAIQSGSQSRSRTVPLGGITYTVTSGASFRSTSGFSNCSASAAASYETTSTVKWTEGTLTHSVESDSLLARSVIGELVVNVNSSSGPALSGAVVTATLAGATGVSRQSSQTNSQGCALFAGLTPGSYSVSVSKSGYVDINGANPSVQTVPVPSTGANASFVLGLASGPINATYASPASTSGEADGFSWLQTGMSSAGASSNATATTGTSTSTLFPGTYAIWGGRCLGQEPTSGATSVTVSPGQSVTTTLSQPTLEVTVTAPFGGSTYYVKPGDVIETYRSGTGCIDSWPASVSSQAGTPSTTLAGSGEPATGWLANPGQPWAAQGTLTVCADFFYSSSLGGNNTWYQGSAVTGNSSFSNNANTANPVTVTISGNVTGQCTVQTS